jgi:hypothetical protein
MKIVRVVGCDDRLAEKFAIAARKDAPRRAMSVS